MKKLAGLEPESVFGYFEEISSIPRGSGDMERISNYCMEFAKEHGLKAVQDGAYNVIIYKDGTAGYEDADPVILQGHLDMVCQRDEEKTIDFTQEGLDIYVEDNFIKARGTTLGADNGIAVAMILAILESKDIPHPPIEAVFTTDEEVGMLGAMALDMQGLKGRKMINIDSEDEGILTVSCAGGSEFSMTIPVTREEKSGVGVRLSVKGLKGGHSGVEIDKGRVNANLLMGRILNHAKTMTDFGIMSLDGGDKSNAIPLASTAKLVVENPEPLVMELREYTKVIQEEIAEREPDFSLEIEVLGEGCYQTMTADLCEKLIYLLLCAPNGVIEMSKEIENLVETSLNLGVLQTEEEEIKICFALRSNKKSALHFLEEKLQVFSACVPCKTRISGQYPPWEFKSDSALQTLYKEAYQQKFGKEIRVEAIHAGLECGVFAAALEGMDCISVGPQMYDIHTTGERLSIASTKAVYEIILDVLKNCK